MSTFAKFFAILFTSSFFASASFANVTFPISGWDKYDGSERLGSMQEQCGDAWPNGFTAKEASAILAKMSRVDAGRLLVTCDPKQLKAPTASAPDAKPAPASVASADKVEAPAKPLAAERGIRHEHPFKTVAPSKQYPCWIDANGRHKVAADDPKRIGLCWGNTAEEKGF